MSGSTNFLVLNPTCANQEADATYASDATRTGGYVTNQIVPSPLLNKFSYQASIMAAALAGMLTAKNYSPNDGSASPGTALATLEAVLANILTNFDRPLANGGAATGGSNPSMSIVIPAGYVPTALFDGIMRISAGAQVRTASTSTVTAQIVIGSSTVIAQYDLKNVGDFVKFAIDIAFGGFGANNLQCYVLASGISVGTPLDTPTLVPNAYPGSIGSGATIHFNLAAAGSGGSNIQMDYFNIEVV